MLHCSAGKGAIGHCNGTWPSCKLLAKRTPRTGRRDNLKPQRLTGKKDKILLRSNKLSNPRVSKSMSEQGLTEPEFLSEPTKSSNVLASATTVAPAPPLCTPPTTCTATTSGRHPPLLRPVCARPITTTTSFTTSGQLPATHH